MPLCTFYTHNREKYFVGCSALPPPEYTRQQPQLIGCAMPQEKCFQARFFGQRKESTPAYTNPCWGSVLIIGQCKARLTQFSPHLTASSLLSFAPVQDCSFINLISVPELWFCMGLSDVEGPLPVGVQERRGCRIWSSSEKEPAAAEAQVRLADIRLV